MGKSEKMRSYTEEFKADALRMIADPDRTMAGVARSIGVSYWTIRGWHRAAGGQAGVVKMADDNRKTTSDGVGDTERVSLLELENQQLRKKVARLEEDREILKKAAAFFAKESS